MKTSFVALLGITLFASCQASPTLSDSWSSLEIQDRFDVEYVGEMRAQPQGGFHENSAPEAFGPMAGQLSEASLPSPGQQWLVTASVVKMSPQAAAQLLPDGFNPGQPFQGGKLDRLALEVALENMLEANDAEDLGTPTVLCNAGENAGVSFMHQVAFLNGFEFIRGNHFLIADPEIGVFQSGFSLSFLPDRSPIAHEGQLEFEVTLTELLKMDTVSTHFPDSSSSLQIQVPVFSHQLLRGTVNLAEDESAFLPFLYTQDEQLMVVFMQLALAGQSQAEL